MQLKHTSINVQHIKNTRCFQKEDGGYFGPWVAYSQMKLHIKPADCKVKKNK